MVGLIVEVVVPVVEIELVWIVVENFVVCLVDSVVVSVVVAVVGVAVTVTE